MGVPALRQEMADGVGIARRQGPSARDAAALRTADTVSQLLTQLVGTRDATVRELITRAGRERYRHALLSLRLGTTGPLSRTPRRAFAADGAAVSALVISLDAGRNGTTTGPKPDISGGGASQVGDTPP